MDQGSWPGNTEGLESEADDSRTPLDQLRWTPSAALVQAHDLRPGRLFRLRRENHSGRARSYRAKHWDEANAEIVRAAAVLQAEVALIDGAAAALEEGGNRGRRPN